MELEDVVAVSGEPEGGADAEPENAADSPVEEDGEGLFGTEKAEAQQPEDIGAPEKATGEDAGDAGRQPKDARQSKADDGKYAAARRAAEARQKEAEDGRLQAENRLKAERNGKDAFARQCGYQDFATMEKAEQIRKYTSEGMPDRFAREFVEMKARLDGAGAAGAEARQEAEQDRQFLELVKAYPETRQMEELPGEVVLRITRGEEPLDAYRDYRLEQLENENQALRQNQKNKKKALGSIKGRGVADNADLFLYGLKG